jgi:c-di-GMP-binding flagellar brake protein YcgR
MNLEVRCGFVILKIGASQTTEILAKTLEANEARGRRKFVRADCGPGMALCAVDFEGATIRADLTDLSSAGMAVRFDGGISLKVGTVLRDISLTVKGQRLLVSGVIVAKRESEGSVAGSHVVMFDPSSLDDARRDKLKILVFRINQSAMDIVLEKA